MRKGMEMEDAHEGTAEHQNEKDAKLKDVEAGSDADETPQAEVGHTPADPNKRQGDKD